MTEPRDPQQGQPPQGGQPPYGGQPPQGEQPPYGGQPPQYGAPQQSAGQPAYGGQPPQYGQQPYPQSPSYGVSPGGPAAGSGQRNGLGIAALVLGILGLVTSWLVIGALFGLLAIIFGFVGLGRVRRREANNRGMSITGIVLGVLSVVFAVLIVFLIGAVWDRTKDCFDPDLTDQERAECVDRELES